MEKRKNIYDICHKVKQNNKINFLAFAITPWHGLGVMAAMEVLNKKSFKLKGSICICPHSTGGILLEKSFFNSVASQDIEIIYYRGAENFSRQKIRQFLKSVSQRKGNDFFVVSPLHPQYNVIEKVGIIRKKDCIKAVVVDEGLATYMRDKQSWLSIQKREEKKQSISLDEWIQKIFLDYYYQRVMQRYKIWINQNLFVNSSEQNLSQNQRAIYGYRTILNKMSQGNKIANEKDYENAVVINTQPYYEEGRIKNAVDVKILEKVCKLFRRQGFKVILKVHPREVQLERYEKLSCIIDTTGGVPMELLLASLPVKPKYLVGFTTTTLVTAKLFFNIKGISLAKFIGKEELEKELGKEFYKFCKLFKEFLELPSSYEELKSILMRNS